MKFTTTEIAEYQKLAEVNTEAVFDYIEDLIENPEQATEIPDGAVVLVPTEDEWVNQKNQELAEVQIREEGGELFYWKKTN